MNNLLIQIHDGKFGVNRSYRSPKRKHGRRLFKETTDIGGCWYFGRQRIRPENLQFPDNPEKDFLFGDRGKANFFGAYFAIARHQNKSCQVGQDLILAFMKELQSHIHYLDCIYAPATETSTIYQICLAIRFSKNYAKLFSKSFCETYIVKLCTCTRWYRS